MEAPKEVKNKYCCDLVREQTLAEVVEALQESDPLNAGLGSAFASLIKDYFKKEDSETEPELCRTCNGSGEGYTSESKCMDCKGSGVVKEKEGAK